MRFALVGAVGLIAFAAVGEAQEVHRQRWGFKKVEKAPDLEAGRIIARAGEGGDTITVLSTGLAHYTIEKTFTSCASTPAEQVREHWVAQVPEVIRDRVAARAARAEAEGRPVSATDLLDLVRFPRWERSKETGYGGPQPPSWAERHQEDDGSWSPGDCEFHCREDDPPICTGGGRDQFRLAATALMGLCSVNAGWTLQQDTWAIAGRGAIGYVALNHHALRVPFWRTPHERPMTNACVAILLSRTFALMKKRNVSELSVAVLGDRPWSAEEFLLGAVAAVNRVEDGSAFAGGGMGQAEASQRVSASAWSMLALKAGATAGIDCRRNLDRGREWLEDFVGRIERIGARGDPARRTRARASRAVVRAATGAPGPLIAEDVEWLLAQLDADSPHVYDAEVLLFGTYAARKAGEDVFTKWKAKTKGLLMKTQERDGCASGTWTTPSSWSGLGGRVLSTALMTWTLEVWYEYPDALWLD